MQHNWKIIIALIHNGYLVPEKYFILLYLKYFHKNFWSDKFHFKSLYFNKNCISLSKALILLFEPSFFNAFFETIFIDFVENLFYISLKKNHGSTQKKIINLWFWATPNLNECVYFNLEFTYQRLLQCIQTRFNIILQSRVAIGF